MNKKQMNKKTMNGYRNILTTREAKLAWAERVGARWISLQHDGVVIALRTTMTHEWACSELARECKATLGYRQPVTMKEMLEGVAHDVHADHAMREAEPHVRMQLQVEPIRKSVCFRVSAAQIRREGRLALDDPNSDVRCITWSDGGAGRCARTRAMQTRTESLRR